MLRHLPVYTVPLRTAEKHLIMERPGFSSTSDGRVSLFGPNPCLGEYKRVHNRQQVNSDDNDNYDQTMLI